MKKANKDINITDLKTEMLNFINDLEQSLGYEITITSGYRSSEHPIEAKKNKPGEHTEGLAIDVAAVGGTPVYKLVKHAMDLGCKRIGISRKSNFVHLGLSKDRVTSIWTY
jgi:uncharacterized protein YcbK (DUF882 family)|tara:strand:+ start:3141 stop:3473 length:333 start_codon:yes stop_codon:yes gene_type:complete